MIIIITIIIAVIIVIVDLILAFAECGPQVQVPTSLPSIIFITIMIRNTLSLLLQNVDHKCKFRSKKGMLPFIEINGEEVTNMMTVIEMMIW